MRNKKSVIVKSEDANLLVQISINYVITADARETRV